MPQVGERLLFPIHPLKWNVATDGTSRVLRVIKETTFKAINIRWVFTKSSVLQCRNKDVLTLLNSSVITHHVEFTWSAIYVSQTIRQLSARIKEQSALDLAKTERNDITFGYRKGGENTSSDRYPLCHFNYLPGSTTCVEIRPQIWSDLEAVVVHHSKPRTFVLTGIVEQEIRKVWDTK